MRIGRKNDELHGVKASFSITSRTGFTIRDDKSKSVGRGGRQDDTGDDEGDELFSELIFTIVDKL